MKKINRRTFLQKAGLVTAGLVTGAYTRLDAAGLLSDAPDATPASAPAVTAGSIENSEELFTTAPADHGRALINPGMGWTMHFYSNILDNYGSKLEPSDTLDYFPGLSTVYLRVPWAFVEPEEGRYVWELLDTPAQRWIEKGKCVAFRISAMESWMYQATPKWVFEAGAKGYDVDGTLFEPDYDDPVFLEKVENFIQAMAERYDGNPRVAFVDVGHFGMWGEGHTIMTTPKHGHSWGIETQKRHIDLYCRHFRKTQLCISDDFAGHDQRGKRFPITDYAFSRGVTLRDDSILVQKAPIHWYHDEMAQLFWPTLPVILEHEHYGGAKERGSWDPELFVQSVEDYHAAYMSIHWWPDIHFRENRNEIDRINRRLGYRLRINEAQWPQRIALGEDFIIQSSWSNAGVAPCYRGGYPCFTLKDDKGGIASVLVDKQLNVSDLDVATPEQAPRRPLTSQFVIAPAFADKASDFFRACRPGTYSLYVSVGEMDGTPVFELPYEGCDGHKRYKLGQITLTER